LALAVVWRAILAANRISQFSGDSTRQKREKNFGRPSKPRQIKVRLSMPGWIATTRKPASCDHAKAPRREVRMAVGVIRLEVRGRADEATAGPQHARHLGEQLLGIAYVANYNVFKYSISARRSASVSTAVKACPPWP
jgi:hypothetical protein